jgi:predicted NBD/HSP70 family sugar kinase
MYVALDIGGTNIRAAFSSDLKDLANSITHQVIMPVTNDYTKDLESILATINKVSELRGVYAYR